MKHKQLTVLFLAAAMGLSLTACSSAAADDAPQDGEPQVEMEDTQGIAVQVAEVTSGRIATENKVSGQISADETSTIMVGTAAKCTAVYVQAGDRVEAGDYLCTLELDSTMSSYQAARISYQSAMQTYQDQKALLDKQVELAKKNAEDTKALFAIGAASQLEVDNAELTYQSAVATRTSTLAQLEASIQSAKSGMEQLNVVINDVDMAGNVVSPISGTVASLNVEEGGYASNAMPVAIIEGEGLKLTASVSEVLVASLAPGDSAEVSISAVDQRFETTIRSVDQSANVQTKLYTVTLDVPEDAEGLLSGMFADVTFHTNVNENTVIIPTEAILTSNDAQYVFVVEDDAAKYVEIVTGLTGDGVTEVTSGLEAGMQLVTVGQAYLADGDAVRIVSDQE